MTVGDLYNMFLRLVMASKENDSEFRFDTGEDGAEPLGITAVDLDEDGDVCLECDSRCPVCMCAIELAELLRSFAPDSVPYFESGTINFTVNSVYMDEQGCLCLESNEIEELDNYTSGLIIEELSQAWTDTEVYLFDDDSKEYYGIYADEHRTDPDGNPWINVR